MSERASGANAHHDSTDESLRRRLHELERALADAQRDAELERALDRLRARTLTMTLSDELSDVVAVLYRELTGLGVGALMCELATRGPGPDGYTTWMSNIVVEVAPEPYRVPYDLDHAVHRHIQAAWDDGTPYLITVLQGEEKRSYTSLLFEQSELSRAPVPVQAAMREVDHVVLSTAFTPHSFLEASGPDPLSDDDARTLQRFASAFDLTYQRFLDLQQAEAKTHEAEAALGTLRATQARLVHTEKMASLGALTAGIAHEIKNPLNFVTNFAALSVELLDDLDTETDPAERAALLTDLRANAEKIQAHGRRADAIVRSMMDHARSGGRAPAPVDLNALVGEYTTLAVHAYGVRHPASGLTVVRDLGEHVGEGTVAVQEIGRVLVNLLDNAFDAAASAAGPPIVTVSTRRGDDGVEIRVADNGPGIAPSVAGHVFEPFVTTKPAGQGTGLGLSLSHDTIVQGHGGSLTVEATGASGTTFLMVLPAAGR